MLSQKCQYAVRAVFELAKHHGGAPMKVSQIAAAEAIPPRFLELILNELKQAGFVESRRGADGGYLIARHPAAISVGEVIRFVEGPLIPVDCTTAGSRAGCSLQGGCVFLELWKKAESALSEVYDGTSFRDLVEREAVISGKRELAYVI
jgi:Rrf2 family protein